MRLRTRLLSSFGARPFLGSMDNDDTRHDAMAAHALLRAIEAWGKHPGYQGGASWVEKRAAEILAGWLGEE